MHKFDVCRIACIVVVDRMLSEQMAAQSGVGRPALTRVHGEPTFSALRERVSDDKLLLSSIPDLFTPCRMWCFLGKGIVLSVLNKDLFYILWCLATHDSVMHSPASGLHVTGTLLIF